MPKYIGPSGFIESLRQGLRDIFGKTEVDINLRAEPGTAATVGGVKKGPSSVNIISEGYLRTFGGAL